MKRNNSAIVFCLSLLLLLSACSTPASKSPEPNPGSAPPAAIQDLGGSSANSPQSPAVSGSNPADNNAVDIDLTVLSSTMVYSEVWNMTFRPDTVLGKRVKMAGAFSSKPSEFTDEQLFSCIVKDATACCAQGIQFVLEGDYTWPEDYPEEGSEITVEGIFDLYEMGAMEFCRLIHATMSY